MTKKDALSATMLAVLRRIADNGGAIYRWPGGYWCCQPYEPGASFRPVTPPYDWCAVHTVRALEVRGLLERTGHLSEAGVKALREAV